jgi:membrane protein DedA with SNARE-associated domain
VWLIDSYAQDIVEFAPVHEVWATPIAFMLAFGESLAVVSLFILAWAALVGIGALIEAGELRFWPIWVGDAMGAAIGDRVSYWLGIKSGFLTAYALHASMWHAVNTPDDFRTTAMCSSQSLTRKDGPCACFPMPPCG